MLLAEIRGKLRGSFDCTNCGTHGAIAPEASLCIEDALTSTVFGAMRWLRPELGILPLFRRLELPADETAIANIELWPWHVVSLLGLEASELSDVGCEPDALLHIEDQGLVLMEAKRGLGIQLGDQPLQLPKEAVVAHRCAKGRPWRLLCVTSGTTAPWIRGFRAENGRLILADSMPLADAVASYFEAAATIGSRADWPLAADVRANTRWMSWSTIGALMNVARTRSPVARQEAALLSDVVGYLKRRGLMLPEFRGFEIATAPSLLWDVGKLWRHEDAAMRRATGDFRGFTSLSAMAPTSWPKLRWFFTTDGRAMQ